MSHLDYFNDKDKTEIEKELKRLCQIRFERDKEFESKNKKRNIITIIGFALLFFLLICIFGKPTGADILWVALISVFASIFYYFINFSIFISWLATKGTEEHNRLSALNNDIKYLESLYDKKAESK